MLNPHLHYTGVGGKTPMVNASRVMELHRITGSWWHERTSITLLICSQDSEAQGD